MTSPKTHVLLVGRGAPETGGIAAFLAGLDDTDNAGFETQLLNLTHAGDMGDGGRVSWRNVMRTVTDIMAVLGAARTADIVHIHSALAPTATLIRAGLLAAAGRARRRPVVVHAHGGRLVAFAENTRNRRLVRTCLRPATHLIAVSRGVADVLENEFDKSRVTFVPNGVDTERFQPGAEPGASRVPRILYVGHLTERKGVLDLIRASQLIRDSGMEHELMLVGGRSDEGDDEYRRVLREIENSQGAVQLVGSVEYDAMPAIYQDADIFCLASWWEAMPLSILEAMASGIPVVATDVGDVSMQVDHGRTGLIVDPKSPDELAEALATVLGDPALRRQMSEAGRRRAVDDFSIDSTHLCIASIYEGLL